MNKSQIKERFGAAVLRARTNANLSQKQLAEKAGLHSVDVCKIERGYNCATLWTIVRLAKGPDIEPGTLVSML